MKAVEMSYTELVALAKSNGIAKASKVVLIEKLTELGVFNAEKRKGRPVNPDSAHAKKMAAQAERIANGEVISRGRPVNPDSNRQKHFAAQAAGLVKRGRPVNPDSAHAKRQVELDAKREANGGVLPLGRPKATPTDTPVVE